MAKIAEIHLDSTQLDETRAIVIAPPNRRASWVWVALFAVLLIGGASIGLALGAGAFGARTLSNAIQVTQTAFDADATSDTMTN
jgi:hypothetical protein